MVKKRIAPVFVLLLCAIFFVAGCGKQQESTQKGATLTVEDSLGRKVTVPQEPKRIVVLSASFIEPIHALGGQLVGVPNSHELPAYAAKLSKVGAVYNINLEKVVSLHPDLVIGMKGMNDKLVSSLTENNIPVLILDMKTYGQVQQCVRLFGKILGKSEQADGLNENMDKKIAAIRAKLPQKGERIAILHSTAQDVTVQLKGSIAGSAAELLGLTNVAIQPGVNSNSESAPYSLEALVKENPQAIFVTSMGKKEAVDKSFAQAASNNVAWQTLPAVKKHRVFYLPQRYFLLSPGLDYPEAVAIMAKELYPDSFAK